MYGYPPSLSKSQRSAPSLSLSLRSVHKQSKPNLALKLFEIYNIFYFITFCVNKYFKILTFDGSSLHIVFSFIEKYLYILTQVLFNKLVETCMSVQSICSLIITLLFQVLNSVTLETQSDWDLCFSGSSNKADPNRLRVMLELLVTSENLVSQGAFKVSS